MKSPKGKKLALHWQILIGTLLGLVIGYAISSCGEGSLFCETFGLGFLRVEYFSWMGDIFLRLMKMIVIPLIVCALINGISHMKVNQLGRVGIITLLTFKGSMLIAAFLGLAYVNLLKPGEDLDVRAFGGESIEHLNLDSGNTDNFVMALLPENLFNSLSRGDLVQIIVFTLVFAVALVQAGDRVSGIVKAFTQLFSLMLKMTSWVMMLAPFGVFGLIVKAVGSAGLDPFVHLFKYISVVALGLATMLLVVTPALVYFLGRMHPLVFFDGVKEAMLTAFSTSSSAATLPVSLDCVTNKLKLPASLSSFVVTTGATMSMNGAALYESVVTLFLAQAYSTAYPEMQIDLSFGGQLWIVVMVLVSTIGTPGIPHGGLVTTAIVLKAVGLPLEALGLILGVDRILDMARTMTNVTGDCAAAVIVNRFANDGELTYSPPIEEDERFIEEEMELARTEGYDDLRPAAIDKN